MKALWSVLLLCLVGVGRVRTQDTSADIFPGIPTCAGGCVDTALEAGFCEPTDLECLCSSETFLNNVTVCLVGTCKRPDVLATKNVTQTACGQPFRNESGEFKLLTIVFCILSSLFVIQRLAFKIWAHLDLGLDDWFALVSAVVGVPSAIVTVHGTIAHGLGQDVWAVSQHNVTEFGKYFYVMSVLYFGQVTLLKMALLFFYLRIFPAAPVRKVLWGTVIFNALYGMVFVFVTIFQCRPVSYFWTKWDGAHEGKCVKLSLVAWINAGISIALDVWMLAIPLAQLHRLKLDWRKKIGVGMMFSVGAFVTIVSILRLRYLVDFNSGGSTENPTYQFLEVSKWSTIEINVGIICACMPHARLILVRIFPKLLGTSQRYYSNYGPGSNRTGTRGQSNRSRPRPLGTSAISQADRDHTHTRTDPKGINIHKSYAVEYDINDETRLVHMRDLENKSTKSTRSDGDISV